jgi:hypothetical protein
MIFNGKSYNLITADIEYKHTISSRQEKRIGKYICRTLTFPPTLEVKLIIHNVEGYFELTYCVISDKAVYHKFLEHMTIENIEKCIQDNGHTIDMSLYNTDDLSNKSHLKLKLCSYSQLTITDEDVYLDVLSRG